MLAIFSGARQGELIGLKWSDLDWDNKQINIQRTFNNQAWYEPKTNTSNRKIDIGPKMMRELKKWWLECPPNDLDLIFPNQAGGPINNSIMRYRHFIPAAKKAGAEGLRFHDLRHNASVLIEQGENIKYIQKQLGHSNPTVTLNVYAHLTNPSNQNAVKRFEDKILGNGSKMVAKKEKGLSDNFVTP